MRLTGLGFGDLLEEEDEKRLTSLKEKGNEKAATIYELLTAPEPAEGDKNGNVLPRQNTHAGLYRAFQGHCMSTKKPVQWVLSGQRVYRFC